MVCSGWKDAPSRATVGGIEVSRSGGRHSFALLGRRAVRRALHAERPDIVVEDVNKLPLFTPGLWRGAHVTIVPHRDFSSLTVHFDSQDGLAVTGHGFLTRLAGLPDEAVFRGGDRSEAGSRFTFSCSFINPSSSASGRGGQPLM